jgi:hypothetical protein
MSRLDPNNQGKITVDYNSFVSRYVMSSDLLCGVETDEIDGDGARCALIGGVKSTRYENGRFGEWTRGKRT